MKVSTRGDYAARALLSLALHGSDRPTSVKEIAERTGLPQPYLEQILLAVKGAGLVRSKRGVGGGYVLAREPTEITLADILAAVDGPLTTLMGEHDHCEGHCVLQEVWVGVSDETRQILERFTLAGPGRADPGRSPRGRGELTRARAGSPRGRRPRPRRMRTITSSPPDGDGSNRTSPPSATTSSRTIARPSPKWPFGRPSRRAPATARSGRRRGRAPRRSCPGPRRSRGARPSCRARSRRVAPRSARARPRARC